jgi:hypothetical protein
MPRGRMLGEMTSLELTHWLAFWEVEHLGGPEERADLRSGIVASVVANANRDPDVRPDPYVPDDFVPRFGDRAGDEEATTTMTAEAFSALLHARFPQAG